MKPLVGRCTYDLNGYSHRQFWRLVRDLTSCGWTVTIQAQEDRRPTWAKQTKPDAFWCYVKNPGFDLKYAPPRIGRTAWEALKKAVEEVVNPAESGTANAEADWAPASGAQVQRLVGRIPDCPRCGDNRQVWANQITGVLTCHRAGCHTAIRPFDNDGNRGVEPGH